MKIKPNLKDSSLTRKIYGFDESFKRKRIDVVEERPVTLFLNSQEIVTMMTINDYPEYLALGYLLNQKMINVRTKIESIEYYSDLETVVVRTKKKNKLRTKIKKKNYYLRLCSRNAVWEFNGGFRQSQVEQSYKNETIMDI